jgi:UrcA family protein
MFNVKSMALALTAAAAGVLAGGMANAQNPQPLTTIVKYDASLLDTDEGARRVYYRLVLAAEKVCPENYSTRIQTSAVVECRKQAIAQAVEKIHSTRLAALSDASRHG